jgi:RHS repeat-associated protein
VHGPEGIHAQKDATNNWEWMIQDGLGSVRMVVDADGDVLETRVYDPYGSTIGTLGAGTTQTNYGFTGEQKSDMTDLLYLRSRYYSTSGGVFTALDPFEGMWEEPMSINGYSYVHGNPVNFVDPSGACGQPTNWGDLIDANCYYSAEGLARRFSGGDPNLYQTYFNILIQKSWEELKIIEATGSFADITGGARQFLDNAAIIPRLFRQNPQVALQALQLYGCSNQGTVQGQVAYGIVNFGQAFQGYNYRTQNSGPGNSNAVLLVVIGGVVLAVGAVVAWDELTRPYQSNFDYEAAKQAAIAEIARRLTNPAILFRGTAMRDVFQREGLHDNRLWVFRESHFIEAVGYAKRNGMINNDTAAVAVYGMIEQIFNSLISSGNIRIRFGMEYGLDTVAQASLVGPVVIPIPDLGHS